MFMILTFSFVFCSRIVFAEQNNYGPRLEVGIGSGFLQMLSEPDWSSKSYYSGSLNYAYRIIYGFSLQGGNNLGFGAVPSEDWYNYGTYCQINSKSGTYRESSWLGARYEIPMSVIKKDFKGIDSILVSGGLSWDKFAFKSKTQKKYEKEFGWKSGEVPLLEYKKGSYDTADLEGYYISVAARWRFDTVDTVESDSWLGSYGIDLGVKYNSYNDSSTKYDNLEQAKSNMGYYQVFIVIFMKLKFLY